MAKHLYRGKGTQEREKVEFEKRYEAEGKSKEQADYYYGATVGKVARERKAKRESNTNKMARLRAMRKKR